MPDDKSWWGKLPEPIASIKGNALWSVISVIVGSLGSAWFTAKVFHRSLVVAAYIAFVGIGVSFIIGGVISFLRARSNKAAIEGMCVVLISDCKYLLKTYRHLDYLNREKVRYPLNGSSWPSFDQPWDGFAVQLYSAKDFADILWLKVGTVWKIVGRKDQPGIFRLTEKSLMIDVIGAIEDLLSTLEKLRR